MTLPGFDSRSSNAAHCCKRVWAPECRPSSVRPSIHVCVCVCWRGQPLAARSCTRAARRLAHTWHVAELSTHHDASAPLDAS